MSCESPQVTGVSITSDIITAWLDLQGHINAYSVGSKGGGHVPPVLPRCKKN